MKKINFIFLLLIFCSYLEANNQRGYICGHIKDAITSEAVLGVKIYLLSSDSTVLDSAKAQWGMTNNVTTSNFSICTSTWKGMYILKFIQKNYQIKYVSVKMDIPKRGNGFYDVGDVLLSKRMRQHQLGQVIVRATKVKIFHNGDTLVYNADAFNLAKGSMLDALIATMPGVQLKDDGRIYVNGRYVDELLLNGKDFFHNDRNVLLENLPAYMVKFLKIYEREDNYHPENHKKLVMDVQLKKEYAIGWISNMEVAGGSKDRYLAKIFGLRFSYQSRLSIYGNINNVNDNRKPGRTGDWTPEQIDDGLMITKKAGLDFMVDDKYGNFKINTSNQIQDVHNRQEASQSSRIFLPTGDMFGLSEALNKKRSTNIYSQNDLQLCLSKRLWASSKYNLNYLTYSSLMSGTNVDLNVSPDSLKGIQDIFREKLETLLYSRFLNRDYHAINNNGYKLKMDGEVCLAYETVPAVNDNVSINFMGNYHKENTTTYSMQKIEYPATNQMMDYRHHYMHTPQKDYSFGTELNYNFNYKKFRFMPKYKYLHVYNSSDRSLFSLEKLQEWSVPDKYKLNELPSTMDSLQLAMDARNSYFSSTSEDRHTAYLQINGRPLKYWNFELTMPININYTHLNYRRNVIDTVLTIHTTFFEPRLYIEWMGKKSRFFNFNYEIQVSAPSLVYRLDIYDDIDPLNITFGNNSLSNTKTHEMQLIYGRWNMSYSSNVTTALNYRLRQNALAMGFVYDTKTGIRTTQPNNVNGNWGISGQTDYNRDIDRKSLLTLDTHTSYGYLHNVDLTGTTDGLGVERSVVKTWNMGEEASLNYKIGQNKVGLKGKVAWSDITSGRANFQNMNVWDFQYGVTGLWNLPLKLQLSTDLTMFSRRGYELNSMNTNDLVWNARLSRT
ncbi:MAG: hypothetical protein WCR53_07040, partial [Bacteroidaceae bacterium]